jgi:hypothetical protein
MARVVHVHVCCLCIIVLIECLRNDKSDKFAGQSSYPEDRTAEVVMDSGRWNWTTTSDDMTDENERAQQV